MNLYKEDGLCVCLLFDCVYCKCCIVLLSVNDGYIMGMEC